ncbi:bifunctional adenosylcobinamide kinase/adenosylcobinamide-phosphate guanylyltransferase [Shewanella schlegeliana]|uniref:Bifunctional adenosylcobalamin biosynthesis protein n=1 Tax=Shewanella schlegeliana TaxID=190308 RepID=A0ABS1SW54_9GAMM|nr:bifunctional adenosylcobinamide kinase/adenosylcobinamide-phosphate guanylyltransferase [Shewanella schlegeliana]MBL4912609.1 bifunctional adenosylcobinamide kinase/adenosylcobinamide-phosphate guanylyltransferase [Shewanella schlegeliana]MCL1109884.1 bifunctional adenosylcobinamide kinase/adenosylcobinamide-phosphate guanylyltransferase [Shewanella schlegeliana]GIU32603.1 bifunctional adenosylcobinamide kinase/adenosylcobinamide-phosphate guanylyltransferase [Shewanella schlegeliana]
MIHLVLGGARSGKSRFAEAQVKQLLVKPQDNVDSECFYLATAQALDSEMAQRINHHQTQRQTDEINWRTIECPLELTTALKAHATESSIILVDCLTLWLTNRLLKPEDDWQQVKTAFLQTLTELPGSVILVSNEVGCGIVPLGELNRRFVDEAGWLHQEIAAIADRVTLVTAGLSQCLKG